MDDGRRFKTENPTEETLCRGCGYNTTNEERRAYGEYVYDDEGNMSRQYHWCVFCAPVNHPFKTHFFKTIDEKIHLEKLKIKKLYSDTISFIAQQMMEYENKYYDRIFDAPYKEENGKRVYNEYEINHQALQHTYRENINAPRHRYLEALENFGGISDEPPCTRNLTKAQKKKLLCKLKAAVRSGM